MHDVRSENNIVQKPYHHSVLDWIVEKNKLVKFTALNEMID